MPKIDPLTPGDEAIDDYVELLHEAEQWAIDVAKNGNQTTVIRDAKFCLLLEQRKVTFEHKRASQLAEILMALVARAGGKLDVLEEELDALEGLTLVESDVPGLDDAIRFENIALTPRKGPPS